MVNWQRKFPNCLRCLGTFCFGCSLTVIGGGNFLKPFSLVALCYVLTCQVNKIRLLYFFIHTAYIAHLRQQCHNSKSVIFQENLLKLLKCYNFLRVQRRHNCSPAASFANCVMTIYLLKSAFANLTFK